jgi:alcohol dehydrogenase class IV
MSEEYCFHTPAQLNFGEGILGKLPQTLQSMGKTRALIVTDRNLVKTGIPARVEELARHGGLTSLLYDAVQENPTEENVHEGRDLILSEHCDVVIAVGGGSPIDASKAMSMLSVQGGLITEYEYGLKDIKKAGPPLILIPTTAGTGSEATFWSVITDQKSHRKFDVGSPFMAASASFVDPELTYSLPPSITAATGMDALCHALESLVTRGAWNPTRALALEAIRLVAPNLKAVFDNPQDKMARAKVMLGSMTAGMSFPNAGLGAVHGLTAPLGGHFGVPHGVANAIMLPLVMEYNLSACEEAYAQAAAAMGCDQRRGKAAIDFIWELNHQMNIPSLSKYNVTEESLPMLARDALGRNSNCNSNPVDIDEAGAVELFRRALS